MKTKLLFVVFAFIPYALLNAQCPLPTAMKMQDGNNVSAMILNGGDLFWDGGNGRFNVPADDPVPKSTLFAAGLWMGGYGESGDLKIAAQSFGRAFGSFDYSAGPLNSDGTINTDFCENFDKIWKVSKAEIEIHKADFADNGIIDNPQTSIYEWPGRANYHFVIHNGFFLPDMTSDWAPFHDNDNDNIYDPDQGDYPHPPQTIPELTPASINWTLFNDNTTHYQSMGLPIGAEVHLTSWSFDCVDNTPLNNTVYSSHKIINKSIEALDSFHIALFVDFDLGCYLDDYIGSVPQYDAFFAYNSDNLDGQSSPEDCDGVNTYGYRPPAQSIQFLNKEMSYFLYFNNINVFGAPQNTSIPEIPSHYFNYMTGSWRDGTPLTQGGNGYNIPNSEIVHHAFPDNPNDPEGWSMFQEVLADGDRRNVASYYHGTFSPQEVITLDIAYTFHQYSSINDHLEIVNQMYPDIEKVQQMYDMQFNSWCGVITDFEDIQDHEIDIFPNPSTGTFHLKADNTPINGLKLFDISGKLIWQEKETFSNSKILEFGYLSDGIYVLHIEIADGVIPRKLVVN